MCAHANVFKFNYAKKSVEVNILNVNFWILKFMHRPGFEPKISRTKE